MHKTYKYRLYPNKTQEQQMDRYLKICCRLYNSLLEYCNLLYKRDGESLSKFDKMRVVDRWGREHPVLGELSSSMRRDVAARLHRAYDAFFRRVKKGEKPGFPKFQTSRYYYSFGVLQWANCKITRGGRQGRVRIWDLGDITCRFHRELEGKPKTWSIKKTPTGKWFISIVVEVEAVQERETRQEIGLDLGLNSFVVTSDGRFYEGIKVLREGERDLKRLQRAVSRKKKGSGRRRQAVQALARKHEKVRNQRNYIHHSIARELVREYDFIAVEDLRTKNMMQNYHLAKSISDAGWAGFLAILEAKAVEAGKKVVRVDPKNTSQVCSQCGVLVKKSLAVRVHRCDSCGLEMDRDLNAARNVLAMGRKVVQDAAN